MNGQKLSDIAKELDIPLSTVKSRLYTGRGLMEKEFEMSNNGYAKQSYEPETLWIGYTGQTGLNGEPYFLVGNNKIKMIVLKAKEEGIYLSGAERAEAAVYMCVEQGCL